MVTKEAMQVLQSPLSGAHTQVLDAISCCLDTHFCAGEKEEGRRGNKVSLRNISVWIVQLTLRLSYLGKF